MADNDSGDLKDFIRWHTGQSDRLFREVMAKSDRDRHEMQRVIERNSRAFDRVMVSMDKLDATMDDQRDERRALVDAVMRLIDAVNRLGPGGATA